MKFEIINPSDKAFIEGEVDVCCMATILFARGQYGLAQVDGELEMPLFLFGGCDEWFKKQFGKETQALYDEMSVEEISAALHSVHLAGERSSLNDFTSYAHKLGDQLLSKRVDESEV